MHHERVKEHRATRRHTHRLSLLETVHLFEFLCHSPPAEFGIFETLLDKMMAAGT